MPGRTPAEAYRAFIEPLEAAIACLGTAKVTRSHDGMRPGGIRAWSLNGGSGMALSGAMLFEASMHYEIVPFAAGWRVTTHAYMYGLLHRGEECFAIHWHPAGRSPHRGPHVHLPLEGARGDIRKQHLPTGRMTLEDAVAWAVAFGAAPVRDDWAEILDGSRALHVQHRSWNADPESGV